MAKLTREIQKIFATDAQATQITAFRTAGDVPTYTKDVSLIQNTNFTNGWLDADNSGNVIPYAEDMNGLFYTLSRNIAYLNQAGIPEWSNAETYYENAMCMYSGVLYISLQDNNSDKQPDTQTSYWSPYASPVSGSVTSGANLGTGEGIYASTAAGTMNFKSLVAGSNITLTPSLDGTSVTIDASNGGALTSVSWGDIQGSLANQSDLASALSQRGTLSGSNNWTGSNTFSSITLGSSNLATTLSNKQDVINANNKLSASYVSGLATVATSGSYNDLSNKPPLNQVVLTAGDVSYLVYSPTGGGISFNQIFLPLTGGELLGDLTVNGEVNRQSGNFSVRAYNGNLMLVGKSGVYLRSADTGTANAGTNLRAYTTIYAGKSGNENPIVTFTGSDIRMKKDISDAVFNGLDTINKVHLVNFRYNVETAEHYQHVGVIAQEVEKDIPDAKDVVLHGDDDEKDMLYVDYGMFAPYLIKAVQELSAKVSELEAKLKEAK